MSSGQPARRLRLVAGLLVGLCAAYLAPATTAQKLSGGGTDGITARFRTRPNLPASGVGELTLEFENRSRGNVQALLWDFGDGTTSTEEAPVHTFGPGTFTVSLTAFGPRSEQDTLTRPGAVMVEEGGEEPPPDDGGGGDPPPPPVPLEIPPALSTMAVPLPPNIDEFVKDTDAAVRLGKALFWDVQVGSDGMTACATCHYHAGTDNRFRNTMNPGANGVFDTLPSGATSGPNHELTAADFPFHKFLTPNTGDQLLRTTDDVRGAQGVTTKNFADISSVSPVDSSMEVMSDTFTLDGLNTLQVTGRDAPTNIGAVFFHRLFVDGRANNEFNGRTIWGSQDDTDPQVVEMVPDGTLDGTLEAVSISLENAALASQAVGPPISGVEMSWSGRDWMDLGRKMVNRAPLAFQFVDPSDSVLGGLAKVGGGTGLEPGMTYRDMILAAFQDRWVASEEQTLLGLTQPEENFSMLFGIAVMMYEATLIPDQTPYDFFAMGDELALSDAAKRGLDIFAGKGKCLDCHASPMFAGGITEDIQSGEGSLERMEMAHPLTRVSARASSSPVPGEFLMNFNPFNKLVTVYDSQFVRLFEAVIPAGTICGTSASETTVPFEVNPNLFTEDAEFEGGVHISVDGCDVRVEIDARWNEFGPILPPGQLQLRWGPALFGLPSPALSATAVYDNGFYNIGVSDSSQDLGVGASGPFGPLSLTERAQKLGEPHGFSGSEQTGPVSPVERIAVDGAFRVPTLRNVELTGPFMHNGSMATLEQVVDFYARGTNGFNEDDLAPDLGGFELIGTDRDDLVAFLKSLTDPRVRTKSAPFDHPELPLKHGHDVFNGALLDDGTGNATVIVDTIAAVGINGGPDLLPFEADLQAAITVAEVSRFEEENEAEVLMATVSVAIFLDLRPTDIVSLQVSSSAPGVAVFPTTLAFTPDNFRAPMFVTVTAPVGTGTVLLETSSATSSDPRFSGLSVPDLEITF